MSGNHNGAAHGRQRRTTPRTHYETPSNNGNNTWHTVAWYLCLDGGRRAA